MSDAVVTLVRRHPGASVAAGAAVLVVALFATGAWVSGTPWGREVSAFIAAQQQGLYRLLGGAVRALKDEGSPAALLGLVGLSFAYGVFHAAGPGHGKAVISAYLMASGDTVRRGVVLAFVSALAQGLTAILVVGLLIAGLGMTARAATAEAAVLERLSFLLIAGIGVWLIVREARAMLRAADPQRPEPAVGHGHDGHVHTVACGHDHGAEAAAAAKPLHWGSIAAVVTSVGIRPCMGAILVLVFAFANGLPAAGILAVVAMSLGTGATVGVLAALAAAARGPALRALFSGRSWFTTAHRAIALGGGVLLVLIGVMLLMTPTGSPFGPIPAT